jgi:hypothetical protein
MDPTRKSIKTNKKGIGNLKLRILTSKPGKYNLRFQSGNTFSDKTESFWLVNRILEVREMKDLSANISINNLKTIGANFSTIPIQPILQLKYFQDK